MALPKLLLAVRTRSKVILEHYAGRAEPLSFLVWSGSCCCCFWLCQLLPVLCGVCGLDSTSGFFVRLVLPFLRDMKGNDCLALTLKSKASD